MAITLTSCWQGQSESLQHVVAEYHTAVIVPFFQLIDILIQNRSLGAVRPDRNKWHVGFSHTLPIDMPVTKAKDIEIYNKVSRLKKVPDFPTGSVENPYKMLGFWTSPYLQQNIHSSQFFINFFTPEISFKTNTFPSEFFPFWRA